MPQNNRPLSPHLQVYRLPLTAFVSITHRITGTILALGMILYVGSFFVLLQGADQYAELQSILTLTPVKIIVWLFIYALFFHLCHGLRHLLWDIGLSFEKETMNRNASIEIILAFILTVLIY